MIKFLALTAIAALASAAPAAAAPPQPASASLPLAQFVPPPYPVGTVHTVIGTLTDGGFANTTLAVDTFTAVNQPTKFKCTNDAGCTILATVSVQAVAAANGGSWEIDPLVDGNIMVGSEGYQGPLTTAAYVTGTFTGYYTVAKGTHTIQTDVDLKMGGTVGYYGDIYTITTP